MAIIRARQRTLTAISPHQGNSQFLVPSRPHRATDGFASGNSFTATSTNWPLQTTAAAVANDKAYADGGKNLNWQLGTFPAALALNPGAEFVVIQGGENDINALNDLTTAMTDPVEAMVQLALDAGITKIFNMNISPMGDEIRRRNAGDQTAIDDRLALLTAYNNWLAANISNWGGILIDVHSILNFRWSDASSTDPLMGRQYVPYEPNPTPPPDTIPNDDPADGWDRFHPGRGRVNGDGALSVIRYDSSVTSITGDAGNVATVTMVEDDPTNVDAMRLVDGDRVSILGTTSGTNEYAVVDVPITVTGANTFTYPFAYDGNDAPATNSRLYIYFNGDATMRANGGTGGSGSHYLAHAFDLAYLSS